MQHDIAPKVHGTPTPRSQARRAAMAAAATALLLAAGCSDTESGDDNTHSSDSHARTSGDDANSPMDDGATGNATGDALGMDECIERCSARAVECGAPANGAAQSCGDLCSQGLTQEQATCLETTECLTLAEVFLGGGGNACEIGGGTPGGTPGGGCQGYPRCDGNSVVTCSDDGGAQVTETTPCGANQTCSNGACSDNACIEAKRTGCNPGNNPSNCCDDNMTCFGNGNQQGETICCVPGNGVCNDDDDCCGSDAPEHPWQCRGGKCQVGV